MAMDLEKPASFFENSNMENRYPTEVREMLEEALHQARTGRGNPKVLQRITKEAERIRSRVLKKHGELDIGVPAIRALRNGHE
jgi:hypothetical protein